MSHRQDALVRNLSGGQYKRVSIGVELLADLKLFFLGEPTSGLDPGLVLNLSRHFIHFFMAMCRHGVSRDNSSHLQLLAYLLLNFSRHFGIFF